ncbi:protein FAM13C-like [Echeneis naucrates]|uniref:protein FAM13C-like n=1 Tax=Echeneis naucrates TaxID=173247 RepID=UPI001113D69B|nr:protein FAM13C-like [Echeneis naucrates]
MFCFCLQSSLLKLQALEVEGGGSLSSSPEESPPGLGSKEQKSPCGGREGKTLALCHSADENSPPELLTVQTRPPPSPRLQPLTSIRQPPTPDGAPPPSPHHAPYSPPQRSSPGGEGGGWGGGGALLQLLAGGPSPLPSPRCSSLSHRFNSDPDTAPSPPCRQHAILSRGRGGRGEGSEDLCPPSISVLTRQIQTLKRKVRRFEDHFEQEMKYKPSHNDKYSNPEMVRVMNDLAKTRKQLKELRLRQSVFESKEQDYGNTNACRSGCGQQAVPEHKPTPEQTVESLFRRLTEKRRALGLPDNMKEMTQAQMVLEKITLQKCLLYFESLHGRPGTKQERNLVKPLYDRYKMIKHLLCVSPITTIEEEDGSDEDSVSSRTVEELPLPPPPRLTRPASGEEDSDRDSDPAFVSPLDEVKTVHQQPATCVTTANLHEASRYQLLQSLRETRAEKKTRRKVLREFEDQFYRQTGRICQKEDRTPMKEEYQEYKQLKAKLRLLEVLLSKTM